MKLKLFVPDPETPSIQICNEVEPGVWRVAETLVGDDWETLTKYLTNKGHYLSSIDAARVKAYGARKYEQH